MDEWNCVEVDFGGDETGIFGPRLESGSALYQVDTTATISAKGNVMYLLFYLEQRHLNSFL